MTEDLAGTGLDRLMADVLEIDGVRAAALVEPGSGLVLAGAGQGSGQGFDHGSDQGFDHGSDPTVDPGVIGAAAADLVLGLGDLVARTGLDDELEDVVVTLSGRQYLLRMIPGAREPLALMVTVDRAEANQALVRWELREIARRFDG
jgi:hypothetical protein